MQAQESDRGGLGTSSQRRTKGTSVRARQEAGTPIANVARASLIRTPTILLGAVLKV